MADEGFVIGDRTYPFPTSFRLCDPVLVSEITGLGWVDFVELLEEPEQQDPAAMAGMIGVAVWQGNPRWNRERVLRYVEQLDMGSIEVNTGEQADPPEAADDQSMDSSPAASKPELESLSSPTSTPASTGEQGSDITSPESLPTG